MTTHHYYRGLGALAFGLALALVSGCDAARDDTPVERAATGAPMDLSSATHVSLEPGATSLIVEGRLGAGKSAQFILGAHEGDLLSAHALSPGEDIDVSVHRLDEETELVGTNEVDSFWSGRLPETLGYLIALQGVDEETPYALEIEVPRHLPLDPETSSLELTGTIQAHAPLAYVIPVEANKNVAVSVSSPDDSVRLAIHGVGNGAPLVHWDQDTSSFRGEIPHTQDYLVRLIPGSEPSEFILKVSVE